MITLAAGQSIQGVAGSAAAITYTLTGDAKTTADAFQVFAQGQLPAVAGALHTSPALTQSLVQRMFFRNTTAGIVTMGIFVNGAAGSNQVFAGSIPANGSATYGSDGWKVYDSTGVQLYVGGIGPTGATGATGATGPTGPTGPAANAFGVVTGNSGTATADTGADTIAITGTGGIVTTASDTPDGLVIDLPNDTVTDAKLANMPANTMKGNFTNATADPTNGVLVANRFFARSAVGSIDAKVITEAGFAFLDAADAAAETALLIAATTALKGLMSAQDKLKLDNIWLDVTANPIALVNPTNTAAQNITNMALILAGAPNGSTIYFPKGLYLFNAAWTYPAATPRMFTFRGEGSNRAGSPATTFTELRWTANVGGDIITLPGAGNGWYTEFHNLTFTSSATQSAGALVNVNGNVGTNFSECSFQSVATGQTFFDVLLGGGVGGGAANNSWNSAVIENCAFQGFTNSAIRVNSSGSSLVVSNCVIQGQWGSAAQVAASCVSGGWVGALQLIGCDILGASNNLLLNPVLASSEVCASVQCTNTYFDNALGSCIKVTGTGATVRCKWDTCTFTTAPGAAFSALELGGSFAWTTGGQDLAFVNCNIYNTFGTTGATNGVLISACADVSFVNCKVAGWANGYNITPISANRTNVQILGGTVGPSGGFSGNTTGFNIAGGAYKGLQIRCNNARGNTTALTLGAVTVLGGEGDLFAITENAGINPRMTTALTPPVAVPVSTTVYTNLTGFRAQVFFKAVTGITAMSVNGVATVYVGGGNSSDWVTIEPGGTFAYTFTGTGSWVWVGQ